MPFQGGTISYTSFWGDTSVDSYSTVGFDSPRTGGEFLELANRFYSDPDTDELPGWSEGYKMLCLRTESGAELWGGAEPPNENNEREYFGFDPHFFGKSRMCGAIIDKWADKPNKNECIFEAAAFPVGKGPANFSPPDTDDVTEKMMWYTMTRCIFDFFCPNYKYIGEDVVPGHSIMIQCCAFARDIRLFDTEEKYEKHNKREEKRGRLRFAKQSFSTLNVFSEGKEEEDNRCLAIITGIVKETELKINEKTGKAFYWALVETHAGCQFDVVIHPRMLETHGGSPPPKVGGIIQGVFYLTGVLLPGGLQKAWGIDVESEEESDYD